MAPVRSLCLRVPKNMAEAARRSLASAGVLRTDLVIKREGNHVLLPILEGGGGVGVEASPHWELIEADFEIARRRPSDYRELVDVPGHLRRFLPRAFDVIGRVIVVKIPGELTGFEKEIGRALLAARPGCVSVALDKGVGGEERVRRLEVIAGESNLETVHIEHGARFLVDPSRVYFSPRLATERARVAGLVAEGDSVIDLFAGVGPFSIQIARLSKPSEVLAVDINPIAIDYLKKNIRLNRVSTVRPLLLDARRVPGLVPPADRVIMNLPHSAFDFLETGLALLRPGGAIHLYIIVERERIQAALDGVRKAVERNGRVVREISHRWVRGYSPSELHIAVDLRVG
ncbi:MAG: class I SAM-dependent methyltransferase family protein [Thermoplasmata archaeon]